MTHLSPTGPRLELLPLKAGLPAGQESEATVLVRIHAAPAPVTTQPRPPLNLALVLDRSGSMSGVGPSRWRAGPLRSPCGPWHRMIA